MCTKPVWLYGTQKDKSGQWIKDKFAARKFEPFDSRSSDFTFTKDAPDPSWSWKYPKDANWVPWHRSRLQAAFYEHKTNDVPDGAEPVSGGALVLELTADAPDFFNSFDIPKNRHWNWIVHTGYPRGMNMMVEVFEKENELLCKNLHGATDFGRARTNYADDACNKLEGTCKEQYCGKKHGNVHPSVFPVCPRPNWSNGAFPFQIDSPDWCQETCFREDKTLNEYAVYHSLNTQAWKKVDDKWGWVSQPVSCGPPHPNGIGNPSDDHRCNPPVGIDFRNGYSEGGTTLPFKKGDLKMANWEDPGRPNWGLVVECWDSTLPDEKKTPRYSGQGSVGFWAASQCQWPDTVDEIRVTLCGDTDDPDNIRYKAPSGTDTDINEGIVDPDSEKTPAPLVGGDHDNKNTNKNKENAHIGLGVGLGAGFLILAAAAAFDIHKHGGTCFGAFPRATPAVPAGAATGTSPVQFSKAQSALA